MVQKSVFTAANAISAHIPSLISRLKHVCFFYLLLHKQGFSLQQSIEAHCRVHARCTCPACTSVSLLNNHSPQTQPQTLRAQIWTLIHRTDTEHMESNTSLNYITQDSMHATSNILWTSTVIGCSCNSQNQYATQCVQHLMLYLISWV